MHPVPENTHDMSIAADPAKVSARDRSFLRALVHDDYQRLKADILVAEVECLRTHADCYVLFDYAHDPHIPCKVPVKPIAEFDYRLADYASRAARSGGRMRLHLMQVADGGWTEFWLYALRRATCELSAEVELMAIGADAADEEYGAHIQRLVDLNVTEVHI